MMVYLQQPQQVLRHTLCALLAVGVWHPSRGQTFTDPCTEAEIFADDCPYRIDGVCDAGIIVGCEARTDCFDCDPCRAYSTCDECTAQECLFCTTVGGFGVCSSPSFAEALPQACSAGGGSAYSTSCENVVEEVCNIFNDACRFEWQADLECDAGLLCDEGSDCFDCDPCQQNSGCEECVAAGCLFCSTSTGTEVCSTPAIAGAVPNICGVDRSYKNTCGAVDDPETYVCDGASDSCNFQFNGECEAGTIVCAPSSDCFDCDPCQAYRFEGCETCTSNGCLWCGKDAVCVSDGEYAASELLTCKASDFVDTCSSDNGNTFPDPYFDSMTWIYDQINVRAVWESGITGAGIGIRVNDDGVDSSHPDLSSKFDTSSSCELYTPFRLEEKYSHGTACAALAAGNGNDECSVGIAPDATVSACRVILTELDDVLTSEKDDAAYLYLNMEGMSISSNSYGYNSCTPVSGRRKLQETCPFQIASDLSPCGSNSPCIGVNWNEIQPNSRCESYVLTYCSYLYELETEACGTFLDRLVQCEYNSLMDEEQEALAKGIMEGRDGKGIIYVFASGNDFSSGSDVNFEGWQNTRHTISVGSVGKLGQHASYSTSGAALFVVAPGGDREFFTNNVVARAGGGCYDVTIGTSFSAPVVAGVVALILQANSELSWRDVQAIIASTSTKTDPDDPTWSTNAAGLHHSYLYGFGLIDANAAVTAAKSWEKYPPETQVLMDSGIIDLEIPEFPASAVEAVIPVDIGDAFIAESTVVYLDLSHSSRGHLDIVLTSPSGTESLLHPGRRPENSQLGVDERWKLMTVRNFGEVAKGDWRLSLIDRTTGDVSDCVDLDNWTTNFGGIEASCTSLATANICRDGGPGRFYTEAEIASLSGTDGRTPNDACCSCGGGRTASDVVDVLRSWKLVVYGHNETVAQSSPVVDTLTTAPNTQSLPSSSSPVVDTQTAAPNTQSSTPGTGTTGTVSPIESSDTFVVPSEPPARVQTVASQPTIFPSSAPAGSSPNGALGSTALSSASKLNAFATTKTVVILGYFILCLLRT